jgi:hypothetical protein
MGEHLRIQIAQSMKLQKITHSFQITPESSDSIVLGMKFCKEKLPQIIVYGFVDSIIFQTIYKIEKR